MSYVHPQRYNVPVSVSPTTVRRRKLIGDYIAYRRLIVYHAVFERKEVVCEWL
jgi:hypothetical protein